MPHNSPAGEGGAVGNGRGAQSRKPDGDKKDKEKGSWLDQRCLPGKPAIDRLAQPSYDAAIVID